MKQKEKQPVILVIDAEEGYVNALEIKIVQQYIDKAEIEFITDRTYLQQYLKSEHFITILIVSEAMYSEEVKNLRPIYTFILMDEMGNEKMGESIYGIFRYSSSQSILNTITAKVPETVFEEEEDRLVDEKDSASDLDSNTDVVLVTSASGGVGKTTISLGLALIAKKDKRKVMYFSLDYLFNFDKWLQSEDDEFGNQILEVNKRVCKENFEGKLSDLYEMIKSEEYDLLIIDAGLDNWISQNEICERADLILQVIGANDSSIYASNKLYHMLNRKLINKSVYVCGNNMQRTGKEQPEFNVQNRISHMKNYETQTIYDLYKNKDLFRLYQDMNEKIHNR